MKKSWRHTADLPAPDTRSYSSEKQKTLHFKSANFGRENHSYQPITLIGHLKNPSFHKLCDKIGTQWHPQSLSSRVKRTGVWANWSRGEPQAQTNKCYEWNPSACASPGTDLQDHTDTHAFLSSQDSRSQDYESQDNWDIHSKTVFPTLEAEVGEWEVQGQHSSKA